MAAGTETRMNTGEWLLLLVLAVLWGGTYIFNQIALRELNFFQVVFGRLSGGALILLAITRLRGYRLPLSLRVWGSFVVLGFLNNLLPFSLVVWGQNHISAGLAAILNSTAPLFSLFAVRYLGRGEPITWLRMGGTILGLAGVAVLMGPEIRSGLGSGFWGQMAVLGGSCAYALAGVYARRFSSLPVLVIATGQLVSSALLMLPLIPLGLLGPPPTPPSPATWGALLGLALLSTAVAYIIYFRILTSAGPSNVLLVTLLNPVSALILAALVLGEEVILRHLAGMALIAAALLAIDGRIVEFLKTTWQNRGTGPSRGTPRRRRR